MGVRRTEKKIWTEESITETLATYFLSESSIKYLMRNLYVFDKTWESDYLALTKSGYFYEGEVKISKSDFKADKKKTRKHKILEGTYQPKMIDKWDNGFFVTEEEKIKKPHYFFYAVPEGLIEPNEVPEYAGLVYMTNVYPYWKWVKKAPKLHNDRFTSEELSLTDKFYYNMLSWRKKAIYDYKEKLDETNKLLQEAKVDSNGIVYPLTAGQYKELYEKMVKECAEKDKLCEDYLWEIRNLRNENRFLRRECDSLQKEIK